MPTETDSNRRRRLWTALAAGQLLFGAARALAGTSANIGDVAVTVNNGGTCDVYKLSAATGQVIWGPVAAPTNVECSVGVDQADYSVYVGNGSNSIGTAGSLSKYDASGVSAGWSGGNVPGGAGCGCGGGYAVNSVAVDTTSASPGVVLTQNGCFGYVNKNSRGTGSNIWANSTDDLGAAAIDPSNGQIYAITGGNDGAGYNKIYSIAAGGNGGGCIATSASFPEHGAGPQINPADFTLYYATGGIGTQATLYQFLQGNFASAAPNWSMNLGIVGSLGGLAVQPFTGGLVFATDAGSSTVIVANPSNQTVVRTFVTSIPANFLAVNPYGGEIYIAHSSSPTVTALDPAGNVVWTSPALAGNVLNIAAANNTLGGHEPGMPPGCAGGGFNVQKLGGGDYATIQAAVNALPTNMAGDECVVIRDTQTYAESVIISGFTNNGHRIKIMSDPSVMSSTPTISPPTSSFAAFQINSASVTLSHLIIVPTSNNNYGVFSGPLDNYLTISSVSVNDNGFNLISGGIAVANYATIVNSSVTTGGTHGIYLTGYDDTVSYSTAAISASNAFTFALNVNVATGCTITNDYFSNAIGTAAYLAPGSNYNTISQSTFTGGTFTAANNAAGGDGLSMNGAYFNNVSYSVLTGGGGGDQFSNSAGLAGGSGLYLVGGASNTITESVLAGGGGGGAGSGSAGGLTGTGGSAAGAGSGGQGITPGALAGGQGGQGAYLVLGSSVAIIQSALYGGGGGGGSNSGGRGGNGGNAIFIIGGASNTVNQSVLYGGGGGTGSDGPGGGGAGPGGPGAGGGASVGSLAAIGGLGGDGAVFQDAANYNSVVQSTMAAGGGGQNGVGGGIAPAGAGAGTILSADDSFFSSYIQGSTGAYVSGSTGTAIGGSTLVGTSGCGVFLTGSSVGLLVSTSSVIGQGAQEGDIALDAYNSGLIVLSTNTFLPGPQVDIFVATQANNTQVWITSNTVIPYVGPAYSSYGIWLNGLTSGATIQNNGIYYRNMATMAPDTAYGIYLLSSQNLEIDHNRIDEPGMITGGTFIGAEFVGTKFSSFKFNDINSTAPAGGVSAFLLEALYNSINLQVKDNVFLSNFPAPGSNISTATLVLDGSSLTGFASDYNDFFSSNSLNTVWYLSGSGQAFQLPNWTTSSPQDAHSIAVNPLWFNIASGVEDFHPLSVKGRCPNGSDYGGPCLSLTVADGLTSPTIDSGDPGEPASEYMQEPSPNGGVVNQGSTGGTPQASESYFTQCATVKTVCKGFGCDSSTIQGAVNLIPNPLTGYTCVLIEDNQAYNETVTVANFAMGLSSMTIMTDPVVAGSATLIPSAFAPAIGFQILNASVNIANLTIEAQGAGTNYGIYATSSPVSITSVTVIDPNLNDITMAGILVSSGATISYTTSTVGNATALEVIGSTASVAYSSFSATGFGSYALYLNGSSSGTFTQIFAASPNGVAAYFAGNSYNDTISLSSMTSQSGPAVKMAGTFDSIFTSTITSYSSNPTLSVTGSCETVNASVLANTFATITQTVFISGNYNSFAQDYLVGPEAFKINSGAIGNNVSLSTMTTLAASPNSVYVDFGTSNTVTQSYLWTNGGAVLNLEGNYGSISFSTAASPNADALDITGYNNSISNSLLIGGQRALWINGGGSEGTAIAFSTFTNAGGGGFPAVYIEETASNTLTNCYVVGASTGVEISGSTGTTLGGSTVISGGINNSALWVTGGSEGVLASSNTFFGGPQGAGALLDGYNSGLIILSSNTVPAGPQFGIWIATQTNSAPGTQIWITSNTILPSVWATRNTYGLYIDGLISGATIQENNIYYRTVAANTGFTTYGLYAQSSKGLAIDHNRINDPGLISGGGFVGAGFAGTSQSWFKFNDVNGVGTALNTGYLIELGYTSTYFAVRDNIMLSSFVVAGAGSSSATITVDNTSQLGFNSNYNDYFSSAAKVGAGVVNTATCNGTSSSLTNNWLCNGLQDANSIFLGPLWFSTTYYAEDFHPLSPAGRYTQAGGFVTVDGAASPTIDGADPAEGFSSDVQLPPGFTGVEPTPNGVLPNQGSYGQTDQASKTANLACHTTLFVRHAGGEDSMTIQGAVTLLGASLSGYSCIYISDSATYQEQVIVQGITTNGSSITISADPSLSVSPIVSPNTAIGGSGAFVISNASVNITGITIVPQLALGYGILSTGLNVNITSVTIEDNAGHIGQADIAISSWSSIAYSSVTAGGAAHGFLLSGSNDSISYSTAGVTNANSYALYLNVSTGNTITQNYFGNNIGIGGYFATASNFNAISLSTFAGGSNGAAGLSINGSEGNSIAISLMIGGTDLAGAGGNGLYINSSATNTVNQSTMLGGNGGCCAPPGNGLFINGSSSNTIIQSIMTSGANGGGGASPGGNGLAISQSSFTSVSYSTMSGIFRDGANLSPNANFTSISNSYLLGVSASSLYASNSAGINISGNTLAWSGGDGGGLFLDVGNGGLIILSTNTIYAGLIFAGPVEDGFLGIDITSTTLGAQVWITSNTILPFSADTFDGFNSYGLYLDGLTSGATVQNNGIYFRSPSQGNYGATVYGMYVQSSSGLDIDHNRINNPGMVTGSNYTYVAAGFAGTTNSSFKFNDINSTGTTITNHFLLQLGNTSTGISVKDNILFSSMAVTGSSATIVVDNTSQNGFVSDYNDFFSSNSLNTVICDGVSQQWSDAWTCDSIVQDAHSIPAANPLWFNPGIGLEDFHNLSYAGRCNNEGNDYGFNVAGAGFTVSGVDGVISPTIAAADPSEPDNFQLSGGTDNLGSTGGTNEASESATVSHLCPVAKTVCTAGHCNATSIGQALKLIPYNLTAYSCVVIEDNSTYNEEPIIANYNTSGSSLTIMTDPAVVSTSGRAILAPTTGTPGMGFEILNASVNIVNMVIVPQPSAALTYGIYASSPNVTITSVSIDDSVLGKIQVAGIEISSWTTISYTSITVLNATGLEVLANNDSVSYTTAATNNTSDYAMQLNGASSGTYTAIFASNPGGGGTYLSGASYNTITLSTMTSNTSGGVGLPYSLILFNASSNTIAQSYVGNAGNTSFYATNSNLNTISSCTIINTATIGTDVILTNSSSNTITGSYVIATTNGNGALNIGPGLYNTISFSTIVFNGAGSAAVVLDSSYTSITQDYVFNPSGRAVIIEPGNSYEAISQSTIASNNSGFPALDVNGASSNTITQSVIYNLSGDGADLVSNAGYNTISFSTITGVGGGNFAGLRISQSSFNIVQNDYIQGSTGVYITGSTATLIGASVLVSTNAGGSGLYMTGTNVGLSLTSSTLFGGSIGHGAMIDQTNAGLITLSTNTFGYGSQYNVEADGPAPEIQAYSLYITSNTFLPMIGGSGNAAGIVLEGLAGGATVQNNGLYYRTPGATGEFGAVGMYLQSDSGLSIDHNRIDEPAMITGGEFAGIIFKGTTNSWFKFNDVNAAANVAISSGFVIEAIGGSTGIQVRDNILVASFTITGAGASSATISVDFASEAGFSSDYNDVFSSNGLVNAIQWGLSAINQVSYAYPWHGSTGGQDADSISANPLWHNPAAGTEDFHPATAFPSGRYNPVSGAFDQTDPATSMTIDKADPAEPIYSSVALAPHFLGIEPYPNGAIANQGSYGQTDQASESANLPCTTTLFVSKAGDEYSATIQGAVNQLAALYPSGSPLNGTACIYITDSGVYTESVNVENIYLTSQSSITISPYPPLQVHPIVSPLSGSPEAFNIMNASVTVAGITILPTNSMNYGILASSPNVTITSVSVDDPFSEITGAGSAGIAISSWSTVSYSSVTMGAANGISLTGTGDAVYYSTAINSNSLYFGFYLDGSSSGTFTGLFADNSNGGTGVSVYLYGAYGNTISLSSITAGGEFPIALQNANSNTITQSYISAPSGYAVYASASNNDTLSFSTATAGSALQTVYLSGLSSFTITHSYIASGGTDAVYLESGVSYSSITFSTMTSPGTTTVYFGGNYNTLNQSVVTGAGIPGALDVEGSYNAIDASLITNVGGLDTAAHVGGNYNSLALDFINSINGPGISVSGTGNVLTLSTVTSVGEPAYHDAGSSNTVSLSYIFANGDTAISLQGADYASVSYTTATGFSGDGLDIVGGSMNVVTQAILANTYHGAEVQNSFGNVIAFSTITNNQPGYVDVDFIASASDTLTNSYVLSASTAVEISQSTGETVGASLLLNGNSDKAAVWITGNSYGALITSNTILGGSQAAGVLIDAGNTGSLIISTNTFLDNPQFNIWIATQTPGTQVWITSNTILPALSAGQFTYGIYIDGLTSGATIQNNGIYYRTTIGLGTDHDYGIFLQSSSGLLVDHNRFNQPNMMTAIGGFYTMAHLSGTTGSSIKFNDFQYIQTAGMGYGVLLELVNTSTGIAVKDNIFVSNLAISGVAQTTATIVVDWSSEPGFSSDFNDVFSLNALNTLLWGNFNGSYGAYQFPWAGTPPVTQDTNSISGNPLYFNSAAGTEDFHVESAAGRCSNQGNDYGFNVACAFTNDGATSPTIDLADPNEPFGNEVQPNGGAPNQGSTGNTSEASKSVPQPCAFVRRVGKSGLYDFMTIQAAVSDIPPTLQGYTCVFLEDSALYPESVSIASFTTLGSSITIEPDPDLSVHPVVQAPLGENAFTITAASVNIVGLAIESSLNNSGYGVFASSPNVSITSVTIDNNGAGSFSAAGILISSWSAVAFSSVSITNGHGIEVIGTGASVSYSTAATNNLGAYALYLNGASTGTYTALYAANPGGGVAYLYGAVHNMIILSTMTTANSAATGNPYSLTLTSASYNTLTQSYFNNGANSGLFLQDSNFNTISFSTAVNNAGASLVVIGDIGAASGSSSNTFTDDYLLNENGNVVNISFGNYNTIGLSTVTTNSPSGDILFQSSANIVTQSYLSNPGGFGIELTGNASSTTISQSTITVSASGSSYALFINGTSNNALTQDVIINQSGAAAVLTNGTAYNSITLSSLTSEALGYQALYVNNASNNTVAQSVMTNDAGPAAVLNNTAYNAISQSTMTSTGANEAGLEITAAWDNTIVNDYIQASTGVYIFGSTATVIGASTMSATGQGAAVMLTGGSVGLTVTSSTLLGGGQGAGIYIDQYDSGTIVISTNVFPAGAVGAVYVGTQTTATQIYITSNTILPSLSNANNTYGLYFVGLQAGATVEQNDFYYRVSGTMGISPYYTTYAIFAQNVPGLQIDHNRINEPGLITQGSFIGVELVNSPYATFKFNDINSTGTLTNSTSFQIQWINSPYSLVEDNVFFNGLTRFGTSDSLNVDGPSETGFVSDYNDFSVSGGGGIGSWGGASHDIHLASWQGGSSGQDGHSIEADPEWAFENPVNGVEDFHPQTQAASGRFDPLTGLFDKTDAETSPTIDAANPFESYVNEPFPNGNRANQGSYGNTVQASQTPPIPGCAKEFTVASGGSGSFYSGIGLAVAGVQAYYGVAGLSQNACIVIRSAGPDSGGAWGEEVDVSAIPTNNNRLIIMGAPNLIPRALVNPATQLNAAFFISNSSVTIFNLDIKPSGGSVPYGVLASSPNVVISSVNVDSGGGIGTAGISITSASAVTFTSITVQSANGLQIQGAGTEVSFSTAVNADSGGYALYLNNASSNSIASLYAQNTGGASPIVALLSGAIGNLISQSTFTATSSNPTVYIDNSDGNTLTQSVVQNIGTGNAVQLQGAFSNTLSLDALSSVSGFAVAVYNSTNNVLSQDLIQTNGGALDLDLGANLNMVSNSSFTEHAGTQYVLEIQGSSNSITQTFVTNNSGSGGDTIYFTGAAWGNTVSLSTITSVGDATVYFNGASSNTINQSYVANLSISDAIDFVGNSMYNTISMSTAAGGNGGTAAVFLTGGSVSSNTITQTAILTPTGSGLQLANGPSYNTISQDLISCNATDICLFLSNAPSYNFMTQDFITTPGQPVYFLNNADYNTLTLSTMSTTGAYTTLTISESSGDVVFGSYIQGPPYTGEAVEVSASTGTILGSNTIFAPVSTGVFVTGGNVNAFISSNTITSLGGAGAAGLWLDVGNTGSLIIATNTILPGAQYGIYGDQQPGGTSVLITSNTIIPTVNGTYSSYGLYLNIESNIATVDYNDFYYRNAPASMGGNTSFAAYFSQSDTVIFTHNRINEPGLINGGNFTAIHLNGSTGDIIKFNDISSTGTGLATAYLIFLGNSGGTTVKDNVFSSSWTVSVTSAAILADFASESGFTADYNDYFSSNASNFGLWGLVGGGFVSYSLTTASPTVSAWSMVTGQDAHSISANPIYYNTASGAEDFHPMSKVGRCTNSPQCTAFANDPVTSPTIDTADPAESSTNEQLPNGGIANQGSYGDTNEASLSPTAPINPTLVSVTSTTVSIQFNAVDGNGNLTPPDFYQVDASTDLTNPTAIVFSSQTALFTGSLLLQGLTADTTYFIRTESLWNPGTTVYAAAILSTSTYAAYPVASAFTNIDAYDITANWTDPGNPFGSTQYDLETSTWNGFTGAVTDSTTYNLSVSSGGLAPNTTYYFQVAALDNSGAPTPFTVLGGTSTLAVPPGPAASTFTAVTGTALTLNWSSGTAAAGFDPAGTLYVAQISTDPAFILGVYSSATLNLSATFNGLSSQLQYYAQIEAVNNNGMPTGFAAYGSTTTPVALPGVAEPTFNPILSNLLTVNFLSNSDPPGTTYYVQISTNFDLNTIWDSSATYNLYATFLGLDPGTTYYAQAAAYNIVTATWTSFVILGSSPTVMPAPTAGTFLLPDFSSTSLTAYWGPGANPGGTLYDLFMSSDPTFNTAAVSSQTYNLMVSSAGLVPNTTYYFQVAAVSAENVYSAYTFIGSTATFAAPPLAGAPSFLSVSSGTMAVSWNADGNPIGVTTYTVVLSTDGVLPNNDPFNISLTTLPTGPFPSATITGLNGLTTYYLSVSAVNFDGFITSFTLLGSTETVAFSSPTIIDNQIGDAVWRGGPSSGVYNVSFQDFSGTGLDSFQVEASTMPGGVGPFLIGFTNVVTNISGAGIVNTYATPWSLPPPVFSALLEGPTNYITVKAVNKLGDSTVLLDAFYVKKDTTPPNYVNGEAGGVLTVAGGAGTLYNLQAFDATSGLAKFQYSASLNKGSGDASLINWTDVTPLTVVGSSYSTPSWQVTNFTGLKNNATNYISVRAWDVAGTTSTVVDAFFILKDTAGPTVGITAPTKPYISALSTISGTAADFFGVQGVEVNIQTPGVGCTTGCYWDGFGFNANTPVWLVATGTAAWTLSPGIGWSNGVSYQIVARSSDTADIYSAVYSTTSFILDSSTPTAGVTFPANLSNVSSALSTINGTALDAAPGAGLVSVQVSIQRNTDALWWNFFTDKWVGVQVSSTLAATGSGVTFNWTFLPDALLQANLANGTSYFVAVAAADNAFPSNTGNFSLGGSTFTYGDMIPPAGITNLTGLIGNTPATINLTWTAPGDNSNAGIILNGNYLVEADTVSTFAFSTNTAMLGAGAVFTKFSTSTVVPGSVQSYTLGGLVASSTYYVYIFTQDTAGNWSGLSNGATAQADPAPLNAIEGFVTNIATQGITGVEVDAFNSAGAMVGTTFTLADGSGTYIVQGLSPGAYKVQATWTVNGEASSVWLDSIPMGSSSIDFVLNLTYTLGALTGDLGLTSASAYTAASPLSVASYATRSRANSSSNFVELWSGGKRISQVYAQSDGHWTIPNVLPGPYSARAYNGLAYTPFVNVVLHEGELLNVVFSFDPLPVNEVYAFPNPARNSTTFRFQTALQPLNAEIEIFDIAGNLVYQFAGSDITAVGPDTYHAVWNLVNTRGSAVASGVYLFMVKVQGGTNNQTTKVIKKVAVVR